MILLQVELFWRKYSEYRIFFEILGLLVDVFSWLYATCLLHLANEQYLSMSLVRRIMVCIILNRRMGGTNILLE